jgi:hypothetical protein
MTATEKAIIKENLIALLQLSFDNHILLKQLAGAFSQKDKDLIEANRDSLIEHIERDLFTGKIDPQMN